MGFVADAILKIVSRVTGQVAVDVPPSEDDAANWASRPPHQRDESGQLAAGDAVVEGGLESRV